ncbi:hypothetical protein VFPPC_17734 [Pochonia chlamydosporia 170]|uniref:Zn(2)-C6 fungal-type domain-containing protein n=1 Tax=Pochonia chlamydosporia 170 TaxID=1380566 RepID=A0A219AQP0_METCM|nr:hypothetical protein VFPPC_17734 [Pochonia chlamydosporia 170]OWT43090.1 hypothetical protein VFPPC_17734 [Pochonia chlamydosporia 170]
MRSYCHQASAKSIRATSNRGLRLVRLNSIVYKASPPVNRSLAPWIKAIEPYSPEATRLQTKPTGQMAILHQAGAGLDQRKELPNWPRLASHVAGKNCDGKRPSCSHCDHHGMQCEYITDAGESRSSAFKRKYNTIEEELNTLRRLFSYIQDRPQSEAQGIMARLQSCKDPAESLQHFVTETSESYSVGSVGSEGDFVGVQVSQTFSTDPSQFVIDPSLLKLPVKVPARPWTTVAGNDAVSEIISQFFIDGRPLALPIVNHNKFVEEMNLGDPKSASCCSPLLVNAICAQQLDADLWTVSRQEMGQRFLNEAYKLLRETTSRVSLPLAQAVNLLYQAELAKDIFSIASETAPLN